MHQRHHNKTPHSHLKGNVAWAPLRLPHPEITGHPGGDSCAEKQLQKEEGRWKYIKEILGWTFNGKTFTIQLPREKCDRILKLIKQVLRAEATPLKWYAELLGKLQHASYGIP
eukprot:2962246-Ditylum_brightwellii.AAC.1